MSGPCWGPGGPPPVWAGSGWDYRLHIVPGPAPCPCTRCWTNRGREGCHEGTQIGHWNPAKLAPSVRKYQQTNVANRTFSWLCIAKLGLNLKQIIEFSPRVFDVAGSVYMFWETARFWITKHVCYVWFLARDLHQWSLSVWNRSHEKALEGSLST